MRVFKTRDFVKFARRARKSGGFRVLLLFRRGERTVFPDGFAKNECANVDAVELKALKRLAAELVAYDDAAIAAALSCGALMEAKGDGEAL